jgi:hypothetical protein
MRELTRMEKSDEWKADAPATHINAGLRQLVAETSDLPVGAVVLLSDGAENATGGGGDRAGSIWRRSARCTIAGCRCIRSGLARRRRRTMWRWTMCGGGEGDGELADDGDGELSSAWLRGAEDDADVKDGDKPLARKEVTLGRGWRWCRARRFSSTRAMRG